MFVVSVPTKRGNGMKNTTKGKAKFFLLGWFMSFFAVMFFDAVGMIGIGGAFGDSNRFVTPAFVSLIVWAAIFLLGTLFRALLLVGMFLLFIGTLFVVPLWAYVGLLMADYLLPSDWLCLSNTHFVHFLAMGLVFLVIDSTVHKDHKR